MASSAFSVLQTAVTAALGNRTDVNTQVQNAINWAVRRLDRELDVNDVATTSVFTTVAWKRTIAATTAWGINANGAYTQAVTIPTTKTDIYAVTIDGAAGTEVASTGVVTAHRRWYHTGATTNGVLWIADTSTGTEAVTDPTSGNSVDVYCRPLYTPPSDLKTILDLRLQDENDSSVLTELIASEADKISPWPEDDADDKPVYYVWQGDAFELYPVPDDAYTMVLRYFKWSTVATTDANTFSYTNMDDVIVAGALSRMYRDLQETASAVYWEEEFQRLLKDAKVRALKKPAKTFVAVGYRRSPQSGPTGEYWRKLNR